MPEQLRTLFENLKRLGPRRLAILGGALVLMMSAVVIGAIYLNKPAFETLYVGLERSDVTEIGLALGEAGIPFDVASDGSTILVPAGRTAQARMLLAEKGLPASTNAGYELFDNVGSLGLTSFMQEVTRVRALEGEIARTLQSIAGIKAARVHIVMPERGNFRREAQEPSASVVIRTSGIDAAAKAASIRYLVAAAVPGLTAEKVTVLDSSGILLAAGEDLANNSAQRSIGVERTVEAQVEENIRRALAPYLGPDNFRASVKAEVNTDSRQIEEVIYDPDSRVERSVQIVRTADSATQETAATPTTVQQNLPQEETPAGETPRSTEQSERREETTNYELNTKRIAIVSNGYQVTRLSIAVVVNQSRLASLLGPSTSPQALSERLEEIEAIVASAAGLDEQRGDKLNVAAVEFIEGLDGEEIVSPGPAYYLAQHAGTLINAAAFILVAFLITWFGLKPLGRMLMAPAMADGAQVPELATTPSAEQAQLRLAADGEAHDEEEEEEEGRIRFRPGPHARLARMVDLSEERTAMILRKWVRAEAEAAN